MANGNDRRPPIFDPPVPTVPPFEPPYPYPQPSLPSLPVEPPGGDQPWTPPGRPPPTIGGLPLPTPPIVVPVPRPTADIIPFPKQPKPKLPVGRIIGRVARFGLPTAIGTILIETGTSIFEELEEQRQEEKRRQVEAEEAAKSRKERQLARERIVRTMEEAAISREALGVPEAPPPEIPTAPQLPRPDIFPKALPMPDVVAPPTLPEVQPEFEVEAPPLPTPAPTPTPTRTPAPTPRTSPAPAPRPGLLPRIFPLGFPSIFPSSMPAGLPQGLPNFIGDLLPTIPTPLTPIQPGRLVSTVPMPSPRPATQTDPAERCQEVRRRRRRRNKCREGFFREYPGKTRYYTWRERTCGLRAVPKRTI